MRDDDLTALIRDGWRVGSDQRWRNDRFGGAYKAENALRRIGSKRGEPTRPMNDEETAKFLKAYAAGANDMEAGRLVTKDTRYDLEAARADGFRAQRDAARVEVDRLRASALTAEDRDFLRRCVDSSPIGSQEEGDRVLAKLSLIANGENEPTTKGDT